jgi:hypothetical protein
MYLELGSWYEPDEQRFQAAALPLLHGAQRTLGAVTSASIAAAVANGLGRHVAPPGLPDSVLIDLRSGVSEREVYRRPFVTTRVHLADGAGIAAAVAVGASRLAQITELDLQQTYAEAAREAMARLPAVTRPSGWQRITSTNACELCVEAAQQVYRTDELNPVHANCTCEVEPLWGDVEPEAVDDQSVVEQHGELGPVLVDPSEHFLTAAAANAR